MNATTSKVVRAGTNSQIANDLNAIFDLMAERGIRIDIAENVLTVHQGDLTYRMVDLERSYSSGHSGISEFPPACEFKLVRQIDCE